MTFRLDDSHLAPHICPHCDLDVYPRETHCCETVPDPDVDGPDLEPWDGPGPVNPTGMSIR